MSVRIFLLLASLAFSEYALSICPVVGTLTPGQSVSGQLLSTDCVISDGSYADAYSFSGTAGQAVSIALTSSVFDTYLLLADPNGDKVGEDDNSGGGTNARIPATGYFTLPSTGTYQIYANSASSGETGAYSLTLSLESSSTVAEVIEYYHSGLDHYFMTADANEAAGLDGNSALGWQRTGHTFNSGGSTPVCRFYGSISPGPNSHFYTVSNAECETLKQLQTSTPATEKRWNFESLDFSSTPTMLGVCESGTIPVYRAYNNGYNKGTDSNHRITRNLTAIQDVVARGWIAEGMTMCAPPSSNKGITGGTFTDPSGASVVSIAQGAIPGYVNASAPALTAVAVLPSGLNIDSANGEANITKGGQGYSFDLTGDNGFFTNTAGAIKISLPFNIAGIPVADQGSPIKIFVRIFNPLDNSVVDLHGTLTQNGTNYKATVELRGLPGKLTAVVIYNPDMDAVSSDEEVSDASLLPPNATHDETVDIQPKATAVTWPSKLWCTLYSSKNPKLIAAVKSLRNLSRDPTRDEIKSTISYKISLGARKAQLAYQKDGFLAPNLFTGLLTSWNDGSTNRTGGCGGSSAMYFVHMIEPGSHFTSGDPSEAIDPSGNHYGRLYISYARIDDSVGSVLGSVQASLAHEMHHAIQNSYELYGNTPRGYKEGTATVYGKTIDNGELLTLRDEIKYLDYALMHPNILTDGSAGYHSYGNEDFFGYVAGQYNSGSLAFISGLYAKMHSDIGSGVINPPLSTLHGATNAYFNSVFALPLKDIYLDFVKQRTLAHNTASQFGRTDEITTGFADNLFKSDFKNQTIPLPLCNGKVSQTILNFGPLSSNFLRIKPTGTITTGEGPQVVVKVTPSFGAIGGAWSGFSYRNNAIDTIKTTNTYLSFGKKAGDEIVNVFVNLDLAQTGSLTYELSCASLQISALTPAKGPVDTAVTITGAGFGTTADTRAVYFNGIKASTVTWSSDTQAIAKVPQNASTGNVEVEVNGTKSNGLPFEVVAQCSATQNQGADTPDTRTVELGKTSGTFDFVYETYTVKDQMLVRYEGATLFDSGCVGTDGSKTKSIAYNGKSSQISVQVIPNCAGTNSTGWEYRVNCPK
jgi:hypothetical protein